MLRVPAIRDLAHHGIRDVAVACGVFDGVHRGHQRLVDGLLAVAHERGAVPVLVTFSPHPREVLRPHQTPRCLTSLWQKETLLADLGARAIVEVPFTPELAGCSPTAFVAGVLGCSNPKVHAVCVGSNWRFGHQGRGTVQTLEALADRFGFSVHGVPEMTWYGRPVSSTRIRKAIVAGRLKHAARMLGRPYRVSGTVAHGRHIGERRLQCPTANLDDPRILLPPSGVYAAMACRAAREPQDISISPCLPAVVYVGQAPTYYHDPRTAPPPWLEVHILDFHESLYDTRIEVEFRDYLRPDQCFENEDRLRAQIRQDIARTRQLLAADRPS